MSARIVVINPNSSEAVTGAIDRAIAPLRMAGGPSIECVTLADGPPGIETQAHVEQVVQPTLRLVRAREDAAAFVIACFSDPGLHALREATARPVLGIAECGMLFALTLGERFGIVSILAGSVPRHLRYVRQLGLAARFAGDLPIGLGVAELADAGKTLVRLSAIGSELRDHHGADVLVLGCAGMAQYRHQIEHAIGLPVVDPTQAAVTMAIGAVRLAEAQGRPDRPGGEGRLGSFGRRHPPLSGTPPLFSDRAPNPVFEAVNLRQNLVPNDVEVGRDRSHASRRMPRADGSCCGCRVARTRTTWEPSRYFSPPGRPRCTHDRCRPA